MTRRRVRGAALITVLATLVAVTAVGVAVTSSTAQTLAATRLERVRTEARLAAEGGIEAARATLRRDPAWTGATMRVGGLDVVVVVDGPAVAVERRVRSQVRGPSANATIEATLRLGDGLPRITEWSER